jgi:trehalose 6-phosphate phosphatase
MEGKIRCMDERTENRLAAADRLWLFLDYDGTLADFAETPEQVEVQIEVVHLLTRLVQLPGVRVSIVSGRGLDQIRRLVPVPGILLAGTYGIEFRSFEGEDVQRMDLASIRPILETLKPKLLKLVAGKQGFYLEDKGWSLALHARFASEEASQQILQAAEQILRQENVTEDLVILGGHKFLEICPGAGNKGATVKYLLSEYPWPGAMLIYLGDDDKDEQAFEVIKEHGGICIRVGPGGGEIQADCQLEDPGDTRRWLDTLILRRENERINK